MQCFSNLTAANLSNTNTGDQSSVSGNAGTATALQTGRTINGVSFDGTANITVTAAANTLTGTTLASGVVTSSLTTLGTIGTGVWQGTVVGTAYGGTGVDTSAASNGKVLIGNGSGLTLANITGTVNRVTVANGAGTITLSGPQDLATSSSPQFAHLGIGAAANSAIGVIVSGTITASGTARGFYFTPTFDVAVNNPIGVNGVVTMTAGGTTCPGGYIFRADDFAANGVTITNGYGYYCASITGAAANWAFFSAGTTASSFGGPIGIGTGTTAPSAKVHALSTTEQLRLAYDGSNYLQCVVGSTGAATLTANGSGAAITFSPTPKWTQKTLIFEFGDGSSTLAAGVTTDPFVIPWAGTIVGVRTLGNAAAGSCVVDVWKTVFGNTAPTVANTITASALPTVTSALMSQDNVLTGWTTSVTANDQFIAKLNSNTSNTRVTLEVIINVTS